MHIIRICLKCVIVLVLSMEILTQYCYRKCNCLKEALTLNKCSQNITMLNIELHNEKIFVGCKNSISENSEDVPSFDAKYLTFINDKSELSLATMANRCYNSRLKGVKYAVDSNKLQNISATKSILSQNNSITYLRFKKKSEYSKRMVTLFQPDFLTYGSQLTTLIITNMWIPQLKKYFDYLPHIETLDLASNQIEVIEKSAFRNLTSLKHLSLKDNKLTSLDNDTFRETNNVISLDLSFNAIKKINKEVFSKSENIKLLNFSNNQLNSIDESAFNSLSKLEDLDLSQNLNLSLQEKVFSNLTSLKSLNLSRCHLMNIPIRLLQRSQNIQILNISRNLIKSLENNTFQNLTSVRIFDLSYNQLESLPKDLLHPLKHLQEIFLNSNKLRTINCEMFGGLFAISIIDLSNNLINSFNNPVRFKASKMLLRGNNIKQFPSFLMYVVELLLLDLSYNNISTLNLIKGLLPKTRNLAIDLTHNQIDHLNITTLEDSDTKTTKDNNWKIMVDLSQNMITCNCLHYQIEQTPKFKPESAIFQLANKETICYTSYPHYNCPLINIQNCPQACNCYYTRPFNNIVVDCSFRNLSRFPQIGNLKTDRYEHNQTFVELNGNLLNNDEQKNLETYSNVTRLNLSSNQIEKLKYLPPRLEELILNDNKLRTLSEDMINNISRRVNLKKIYLGDNPWNCDCDAIYLQKFLQNNTHNKVNRSDIICHNTGELLIYTKVCEHQNVLKIAIPVSIAALFAVFSVMLALYFKYDTSIKVYLYSKNLCLWCVAEEELDKEKTYDVFISYSHKDENFVQKELLSELESEQFKICIHYRDWLPGEFISTQIVKSVLDSRRTLVILSNNFMESVWGKMEFRTAHLQAINEGRARVIVVLYGDLDENILDDEMKTYLRTNTYVQWGDPWFWSKLKYALPHSKVKRLNTQLSNQSQESFHLK